MPSIPPVEPPPPECPGIELEIRRPVLIESSFDDCENCGNYCEGPLIYIPVADCEGCSYAWYDYELCICEWDEFMGFMLIDCYYTFHACDD